MNSRLFELEPALKGQAWSLLEQLFPIPRTLMGQGFTDSLALLAKTVPLRTHSVPSGTKVGSWVVPKEWKIRDAWVETVGGKRLFGYRESPFHVWHYSTPFDGRVSRDELLGKLYTNPVGVPLAVTYYKERWGFCATAAQKAALTDPEYRVVVDSALVDGALTIGAFELPGESTQTVLVDAVLSSPALGNNMTGVVVAVKLFELLARLPRRRLTWRLVLTPETIGPIAIHHAVPALRANVVGGWTLVNLGDAKGFHYRQSRPGNSPADRAIAHALKHFPGGGAIEPYDVRTGTCGNEKAYNSLGIELPMGAFRRSKLGSYPEYDTSADDLTKVNAESLFDSLRCVWGATQALERDAVYEHLFEGEPFLTGYGLLPKIENEEDRLPYDYLMGFTDGRHSLIEIADRSGLAVDRFDEALSAFVEKGLVSRRG